MYQRATWHRGLVEKHVYKPTSPEILRQETDAHMASVEVMSRLLGVVGDDAQLVESSDKPRQVALVALAHMLADAWRVLTNLPRYNASQLQQLVEALYGAKT